MAMGTTARRLGAIALAVAASACGGGGGGDGGTVGGPQTASFAAADPTPPAASMSLQQGTRSGLVVNVLVSATTIDDFFGAGFNVVYDPTVARFEGFDSAGSFLRDGAFPAAQLQFEVDSATPGVVVVSATRQQNTNGDAPGVDVNGTRTLISLRFTLLVATAGSPVSLPAAQRDARDSADNPLAVPWYSGVFLAN